MKLYVWQNLGGNDRYHDHSDMIGGLVVLAENETRLHELLASYPSVRLVEDDLVYDERLRAWAKAGEHEVEPDAVYEFGDCTAPEAVWVFPNEGAA